MLAKRVKCTVLEKEWITPTVVRVLFDPSKRFAFSAGQFLSLIVPRCSQFNPTEKALRRAYSFALPFDRKRECYELCVKHVLNGPGSSYLASLKPGDVFEASAPYGDFVYETKPGRNACFISTGTGLAPFRAMILSREFQENPPEHTTLIYGARDAGEILYPGFFEKLGVETVHALSQAAADWKGFRGRVTDYLKTLPANWNWHETDFYLCGSGNMVADVRQILRSGHGVPLSAIFQEVYFMNPPVRAEIVQVA